MKLRKILFIAVIPFLLFACEKKSYYETGTFQGRSSDDRSGYGIVTIKIEENQIVDCQYDMCLRDGAIKNEDYGKVNGEMRNRPYYEKAQFALRAGAAYAKQLLEVQKPSKVDAVSGATIAYNQFLEALDEALEKAKRKEPKDQN